MDEDKLSVRQLAVCAFAGGLAPAAAGAGHGWQGALLAVPVILAAGWALISLAPRWKRMEGTWAGRTLSLLYAAWGAVLLGRGLARCAARTVETGGGLERYTPWIVVLVALPLLWMGRGKPAAFFRAAEIFYPAVALVGAAVLVWGGSQVEWRYAALPAPDLWGGFWSAVEAGGTFLFVLLYINRVQIRSGDRRRAMGWLAALAAGTVLLALVTVGVLSPRVAAGSGHPFFLMTATLGRAVRVEGLISALWLLADLCCLGLLARSWQRSGTGKSSLPALAVLAGAVLALSDLPETIAPAVWGWGTAALAAVTAVVLLTVKK